MLAAPVEKLQERDLSVVVLKSTGLLQGNGSILRKTVRRRFYYKEPAHSYIKRRNNETRPPSQAREVPVHFFFPPAIGAWLLDLPLNGRQGDPRNARFATPEKKPWRPPATNSASLIYHRLTSPPAIAVTKVEI